MLASDTTTEYINNLLSDLSETGEMIYHPPDRTLSDYGIDRLADTLLWAVNYGTRPTETVRVIPIREMAAKYPEWTWDLLHDKGEFRGSLAKRVDKLMYMEGYRIQEYLKSTLGDAIANHCLSYGRWIDFTQDFSWNAGDFGDSGSCFWSDSYSYGDAREVLSDNGAFAVRFFKKRIGEDVEDLQQILRRQAKGVGRAWVIADFPRRGNISAFNVYGVSLSIFERLVKHALKVKTGVEFEMGSYSVCNYPGSIFINDDLLYVFYPAGTPSPNDLKTNSYYGSGGYLSCEKAFRY